MKFIRLKRPRRCVWILMSRFQKMTVKRISILRPRTFCLKRCSRLQKQRQNSEKWILILMPEREWTKDRIGTRNVQARQNNQRWEVCPPLLPIEIHSWSQWRDNWVHSLQYISHSLIESILIWNKRWVCHTIHICCMIDWLIDSLLRVCVFYAKKR
jgi:hypothetical protein